MELKLNSNTHDAMTIVDVLIRQGYKITIQRIMKEYPYDDRINYYLLIIELAG